MFRCFLRFTWRKRGEKEKVREITYTLRRTIYYTIYPVISAGMDHAKRSRRVESQPQNVFDIPFHALGALLLHLIRDMAVNVQRESGCGKTKISWDCLNIVARANRSHRIGMAQIVKSQLRQTDGGDQPLTVFIGYERADNRRSSCIIPGNFGQRA